MVFRNSALNLSPCVSGRKPRARAQASDPQAVALLQRALNAPGGAPAIAAPFETLGHGQTDGFPAAPFCWGQTFPYRRTYAGNLNNITITEGTGYARSVTVNANNRITRCHPEPVLWANGSAVAWGGD